LPSRRVNGLDNIALLAAAASPTDGVLQLSSEGTTGSALTSIVGSRRGQTVDVEALSLQTIADRHHLDRVDFIKIDIEGAERELVPQSGDFFRRYRPQLVVEPHRVENVSRAAVIQIALAEFGYRFSTMEHRGLSMPFIAATMAR